MQSSSSLTTTANVAHHVVEGDEPSHHEEDSMNHEMFQLHHRTLYKENHARNNRILSMDSIVSGDEDGMFYPLLFSHTLQTNFKYEHALRYIESIKQLFNNHHHQDVILSSDQNHHHSDYLFLNLNLTSKNLMQGLLQNQTNLRFLNSILYYLFKYEYKSSTQRMINYLSSFQSTLELRKHTSFDYTFLGQQHRANYQNAKAKYFYELAYEVDPLNFLLYLYLANVSRATDCVIYQKRYLELGIFKIKQELNFIEHYKQIHQIQTKGHSPLNSTTSHSNILNNHTSPMTDRITDHTNATEDSNKYHLMKFIIEHYEHQLVEYHHVLNLNRCVNDKSLVMHSMSTMSTSSSSSSSSSNNSTSGHNNSSNNSTSGNSINNNNNNNNTNHNNNNNNTSTTTTLQDDHFQRSNKILSQIDQLTQNLIDHSPQSYLAWFYHAFYYGFEYSEMYYHVHNGTELDTSEFEISCRKALRSFRIASSLVHYPYTEIYFPLILENMGMIYENLQLYDKALKYFNAACNIGVQLNCYWSFLSRMTLYLYRLEHCNEEACLDGLVLLQHCMLRNEGDDIYVKSCCYESGVGVGVGVAESASGVAGVAGVAENGVVAENGGVAENGVGAENASGGDVGAESNYSVMDCFGHWKKQAQPPSIIGHHGKFSIIPSSNRHPPLIKDGLDMSFVCMHLIRIAETFLDGHGVRPPSSMNTTMMMNHSVRVPFDLSEVERVLSTTVSSSTSSSSSSTTTRTSIEKDEDLLLKKFPSLMIQSQHHHSQLSNRVFQCTLNDIIHLLMKCDGQLYSVRARWFEKQYLTSHRLGISNRFYALTLQERLQMLRECLYIDSIELEWFIEMDMGNEGFFESSDDTIKKEFNYLWYHKDSTERSQ